jgi:hypothetical protein
MTIGYEQRMFRVKPAPAAKQIVSRQNEQKAREGIVKYIPLHKCSICKNLSENEYGFYSVMADGPHSDLPKSAHKLKPIEKFVLPLSNVLPLSK